MVCREMLGEVCGEDWVDPSRRPYVEGDCAWVPVREGFGYDTKLEERRPYAGCRYYMIGDIAVTHGALPGRNEIIALAEWKRPRGIVHIRGYRGVSRVPDAQVLYGEAGCVRHCEHGFSFRLDPTKVMFAQGNRKEKIRIAGCVRRSGRKERVADMFAGIGYFTIPAAKSGAVVHAMELNPTAYRYLVQNTGENGVADQVIPACGDCRGLLSGTYDRFIMGHFDAADFLTAALEHARAGSVLHLHGIEPRRKEIEGVVAAAGFGADISVIPVKKYAPGRWHRVLDVVLHEG
jgi:tRNA wybutosine-synthesizing protein 2